MRHALPLLAIVCGCCVSPIHAADAEGKTWLLLIAVSQHENAKLNRGVANTGRDIEMIRDTLRQRAGLPTDQIIEIASGAPAKPNKAIFQKEIPAFLAKAGPSDRLIVFYSGHGVIHQDKAYLVPSDVDLKNIAGTAYPLSDLREALGQCQAKSKFLILDCCHAGGASRAADEPGASGEAVARALQAKKLKGTVVLASSSEDEESWEWPARKQGIFTYWLCRALEGGADENGDGKLTFEEVYQYTFDRVPRTAREIASATQTPTRIVGADVEGTPHLLTLLPEQPETVCRRLADQLDLEIRRAKLKKVGVLEFIVPLAKVEGLARANLPQYCAERVRLALAEAAAGDYEVLTAEQMQAAGKGITVEQIGEPAAMTRMNQKVGLDAVIAGSIKRRGSKLHLQCDLVATMSGDSLVKPAGVLPLNEELLADAGASFSNRDRPNGAPFASEVVQHVQEQNQAAHPLLDPEFPFRVEVFSVPTNAQGQAIGKPRKKDLVSRTLPATMGSDLPRSDMLLGVRKDEVIEIHVRNDSKSRVAMTLLVDGVNTLGGQRQRLGDAWSWVLDPGKEYNYEGWYFPKDVLAAPGRQGFKMNRFIFRDAAPLEGRREFGDAPGVITLAFYAERGRDLKLDRLRVDEARDLRTVDFKVGRLLGVAQIRYADAKSLEQD